MNKLEQLQHIYGVDGVYLVTSWIQGMSVYFRYYAPLTHEFHIGHSNNLNTDSMTCKTLEQGVKDGEIDENSVRKELIELQKTFFSYKLSKGDFAYAFGRFLIGNSKAFKDFDFKCLPVETKDGIYYLTKIFRDDKHKVWVELQSTDCCFFKERASFVEGLVDHDKISKDYLSWRDNRIETASLKDLCNTVDIRASTYVKKVLCP